MKKFIILLILVFFISGCASFMQSAENPSWKWDTTNTVLLVADAVGTGLDMLQTRYIADNPDRYTETNKILGTHPSIGEVNIYFPAYFIVKTGIAIAVPNPWRKTLQGTYIISDAYYVINNNRIGIGFKW